MRILTDPYEEKTGYRLPSIAADIVTVSHGHYDHNYVAAASGNPTVLDAVGAQTVRGVEVTGFGSWHDEAQGAKRGANVIFRYVLDDVRVVHLGDLGHLIDDATADQIGAVDVLLCPVGGRFTIDAEEAYEVVKRLNPRIIVPMHYQTPELTFEIAGVEPFLAAAEGIPVKRFPAGAVTVSPKQAGDAQQIWLMGYVQA